MKSYAELLFMETSLQLLQIKDDLERLHTEKTVREKKIDQKLHEQARLVDRNLTFIKIVEWRKDSTEHYSPKKEVLIHLCVHQRKKVVHLLWL